MKFLAFADLHYFKDVYHASVESLEQIMARAAENQVDFVVHLGDFSNDYYRSPEIVRPYLENPYGLAVYGIYGNHELEKPGNTMELVTACLTNRPVHFGVEPETEHTAYWYTDTCGYRLIGLDANYMYHEEEGRWYHNSAETWPFVKGTVLPLSYGSSQLAWLREVLRDASEKGIPAIVLTHPAVTGLWKGSPDADRVRSIFAEFKGTVKLVLNGHHHTDRFHVIDGIAYFDVNTVHNGYWKPHPEHHYTEGQTFSYTAYENGERGETRTRELRELRQAKNTWFFEDPTSAIVTVTDEGEITVEGCKTDWMYGILPPVNGEETYPGIRDRKAKV